MQMILCLEFSLSIIFSSIPSLLQSYLSLKCLSLFKKNSCIHFSHHHGSFIFLSLFIFERERERKREHSRGGAEREGDRIWSRLQAMSCRHRAWCGARTQELWDQDLRRSWMFNRLSHPGTPNVLISNTKIGFVCFLTLCEWNHTL